MNIDSTYLITNIKLSFLVPRSINIIGIEESKNIYKIYVKNQNLIIKGIFGTVTILGKNQNHINLTGIKLYDNIIINIRLFCDTFDISLKSVRNAKIDCISVACDVQGGLKNQILSSSINHFYKKINPPKFLGIILRSDNKICMTYFNSGKLIVIGAKCTCEINKSLLLFNNFIKFFY